MRLRSDRKPLGYQIRSSGSCICWARLWYNETVRSGKVRCRGVQGGSILSTLSTRIERHLKRLLHQDEQGMIEVRRCDLAEAFECVPSQINYVLATRFTEEHGYLVESRRGGGGFIRITRAKVVHNGASPSLIYRQIGRRLSEEEAESFLQRLQQAGALDKRRVTLIRAALRKETSWIEPSFQPVVRAAILKGMLLLVLQDA